MRFRRAQNPQWQVRLFLPCFRASTCELRSGLKPQRLAAQGLFRGMQYEKRRLSLFGCEKFSTNAARGFYIPIVMIQNQIEAQCNGFDLERRNSVVSTLSHMCGSERYEACSDDAADTTAELGCSNCCVCLWVFPADRAGNEREVRNLCCRTQGGRANLPGCVCLASTEQTTWYGVHGHSQLPFCSRTKSGRILYSSGARQTKRDERPK